MKARESIFAVMRFLGHSALATYGIMVLTFGLVYPLLALVDSQDRFLDYVFVGPTFVAPLGIGFLGGYWFGRRLLPVEYRLLWIAPLALHIYRFAIFHQSGQPWIQTWHYFFGTTCVGEDCSLQFNRQVIGTGFLISAFAYSIGAEFARRKSTDISLGQVGLKRRSRVLWVTWILVLTLIIAWKLPWGGVRFEWAEGSGFKSASVERPLPAWSKSLLLPVDQWILLQAKPRISSDMKRRGWKMARGYIGMSGFGPLPPILAIDYITTGPWKISNSETNSSDMQETPASGVLRKTDDSRKPNLASGSLAESAAYSRSIRRVAGP